MKPAPKMVKAALFTVMLMVLGTTVAVFIGYRKMAEKPASLLETLGDHVNASLGTIRHTAMRDGVREWTLEAKSARLVGKENQILLKDLSIIYYLKNNNEVYLTSSEGILNTQSNDIELNGNVVLISEPYELKTEKLNYMHQGRKIYSNVPIQLISTKSYLAASTMSFDLNNNEAQFTGEVEGIFAEKIKL